MINLDNPQFTLIELRVLSKDGGEPFLVDNEKHGLAERVAMLKAVAEYLDLDPLWVNEIQPAGYCDHDEPALREMTVSVCECGYIVPPW